MILQILNLHNKLQTLKSKTQFGEFQNETKG